MNEGTSQHEHATTPLVMRRFLKAVEDGNLLAAEMWADHPKFETREQESGSSWQKSTTHYPYASRLDHLVRTKSLPHETIEWLLLQAQARSGELWRPQYEHRGRKKERNWRGVLVMQTRNWLPTNLPVPDFEPWQLRRFKLLHELRWWDPPYKYLSDSKKGIAFLLETIHPAFILDAAMQRERVYDRKKGAYEELLPAEHVIDVLIEAKRVDLTRCGDELVRDFSNRDEPKDVERALRLLEARDRQLPIPTEFTTFLRNTIEGYKMYQHVAKYLPQLLGAKSV